MALAIVIDRPTTARELRRIYPKVLARVLSQTRDLPEAEDLVQEAALRALELWPEQGLPDSPEAWLVTVATNRYLDGLRRRRRRARHADAVALLAAASPWSCGAITLPAAHGGWEDDFLRLLFTACDPVLGVAESSALALSTVIGLSVGEVADCFVVTPRTMEQRLTRARKRLRDRRGDFDVPPRELAGQRLGAVLHVVHLVFNEGHWSSDDDAPIRRDLCRLAIDLARSLHAMLPSAPEVSGLLALLLLHDARHAARLDPAGRAVPLPEQDRTRWDRAQIAEASALLESALAQRRAGPFQIEAAIAAVHCAAETADATDWRQIAELYALLEARRPSPTVRVNRAFAVARADGARAGLALLDHAEAALEGRPYPYLPLVRGVLLAELGHTREAALELERALPLARNAQERAQIAARLRRLEEG